MSDNVFDQQWLPDRRHWTIFLALEWSTGTSQTTGLILTACFSDLWRFFFVLGSGAWCNV